MLNDKSVIDWINEIAEFTDIHEFVKDKELDEALAIVVKIMMKPDIPSSQAPVLIAKLSALSAKFAVLATWYSTMAKDRSGTPNNIKKNIYYTMKEALDKIVDALKYVAKYQGG
jgi:hypothetical protein